jgi:hypothetical protein
VEVPEAPDPLIIKSESVHIVSDFTPPQTRPAAPTARTWVHRGRRERPRTLAGHRGNLTEDTFSALGMELTREVWIARNRDGVAIRQRVRNCGAEAIRLDALIPLHCTGPNTLLLADASPDETVYPAWCVLTPNRRKVMPAQLKVTRFASSTRGTKTMRPLCWRVMSVSSVTAPGFC